MVPILIAMTLFSFIQIVEHHLVEPSNTFRVVKQHEKEYCSSKDLFTSHRKYPEIYCFEAIERNLNRIFMSAEVTIDLTPDQFDLYTGKDYHEVMEHFMTRQSVLTPSFLFWRQTVITVNPFMGTCIGINTDHNFSLELTRKERASKWELMFYSGLLLFFIASVLAKVPIYYNIVRLRLQRCTLLGIMAGSVLGILWVIETNLKTLCDFLKRYQWHLMVYVSVSGVISFIVCYCFGPVTDRHRTTLIKWGLQLSAVVLILTSSHLQGITLIISLAIALLYYIPTIYMALKKCLLPESDWMPPDDLPSLTFSDEYNMYIAFETRRELTRLVRYCTSPEFLERNELSRLQNPGRFMRFINGQERHVSMEEQYLYADEVLDNADHSDDSIAQ